MARKQATNSRPITPEKPVDAYLASLEHPHKKGVQELRKAILRADARIREEVKWNAPSFYLEHHFATFRLHPRSTFQLIFHQGGKAQRGPKQFHLDDPSGILKWPAKDRCLITFESDADAIAKRTEIAKWVKQWIAQL